MASYNSCHVGHAAVAYFTDVSVKYLVECMAFGEMFAGEVEKLPFDVALCVFAKREIEPSNFFYLLRLFLGLWRPCW